MRKCTLLPLVLWMLAVLSGCGREANTAVPPKIVYGEDVCDRCNMIISEERYAAAYWSEAGDARRFDDIGGMLAYANEQPETAVSFWVHDFETAAWIRAEEAVFVAGSELITPMGFGVVAFADESKAQNMARENDKVILYTFADLLAMNLTMPVGHGDHMNEAEPVIGQGAMGHMSDGAH